ncbi:hypothetical protein ArV1_081 [Arthrobacter phage vB_ArtM-ArV1]|uniref:Uncharacterized protein n=1 Tax=Arthrobacter phage vB_ArtM-ArV1 TaxID=1566993 RepID=A0A0A7HB00_9CAUD|nr:hypothetical protein ArV1_081 [Arthrobacter phage vB_ArtM-ArV1]AIZ01768.1 hypothetical protein ArV1_081 [Arthrobacter phage vB_ArtM-ArV1]
MKLWKLPPTLRPCKTRTMTPQPRNWTPTRCPTLNPTRWPSWQPRTRTCGTSLPPFKRSPTPLWLSEPMATTPKGTPAELRGNCANPECACPIRTGGYVTPETRGARRHSKDGVCTRCKRLGYNVSPEHLTDAQLFKEFEWSPELLADAVSYGMEQLDDVA